MKRITATTIVAFALTTNTYGANNYTQGATQAQQFLQQQNLQPSSIFHGTQNGPGVLDAAPVTRKQLQQSSQQTRNIGNQGLGFSGLSDPYAQQKVLNMLNNNGNITGRCTILDHRKYCETASWTRKAKKTQLISNQPQKTSASLALCKQYITPPQGFTNNDLTTASGIINKFTGTLTCNYKLPPVTKKVIINTNFDGSAFLTKPIRHIPVSSNTSGQVCFTKQPSQQMLNTMCQALVPCLANGPTCTLLRTQNTTVQ